MKKCAYYIIESDQLYSLFNKQYDKCTPYKAEQSNSMPKMKRPIADTRRIEDNSPKGDENSPSTNKVSAGYWNRPIVRGREGGLGSYLRLNEINSSGRRTVQRLSRDRILNVFIENNTQSSWRAVVLHVRGDEIVRAEEQLSFNGMGGGCLCPSLCLRPCVSSHSSRYIHIKSSTSLLTSTNK